MILETRKYEESSLGRSAFRDGGRAMVEALACYMNSDATHMNLEHLAIDQATSLSSHELNYLLLLCQLPCM